MTNDDDLLPGLLLNQVRQARKAAPKETTLDYAIDAAVAVGRDEQAWALVALAARLREDGDRKRGLAVLDAAVALNPGWEVQSAAFTTAAAIHCDLGDLDTARAICDQTLSRGVDKYILSAAVRVYWELARSTKLQEFHDRRKALSIALEELETDSANVAS
jgi:hypothetical protein